MLPYNSKTYHWQKLSFSSVYIFPIFVHSNLFWFVLEILHTLTKYVSRRSGGQLYILFYDQCNWDRNVLFHLLWYTFHHNVGVLWALVWLLNLLDFKKSEYLLVHSLIVQRVTLIPSCCQRWFLVFASEKPSSCIWTARTISSGLWRIRSKPSGSTNWRLQDLHRKLIFILTFRFLVPFLTTFLEEQ